MRIRRPTVQDAEALTALHLDVWDEAYRYLVPAAVLADRRRDRAARVRRWHDILARGTDATWLAEDTDAGELVGFSSVGPGRDLDPSLPALELMALYVREQAHGTGVGRALLGAAVGEASAYLWVLGGNTRAVRFYARHGFGLDGCTRSEPVGTERRMVRDQDTPASCPAPDDPSDTPRAPG